MLKKSSLKLITIMKANEDGEIEIAVMIWKVCKVF